MTTAKAPLKQVVTEEHFNAFNDKGEKFVFDYIFPAVCLHFFQ